MRTLVIDDEVLARKRILNLLHQMRDVQVVGECGNGREAVLAINQKHPDLLFLDINMKDMNGFEVLQNITVFPKPIVVFVTAYDTYALHAFEVEAFDFLLKPFKDERFFRTMKKVRQISANDANEYFDKRLFQLFNLYNQQSKKTTDLGKLPVKQGNKTVLIALEEIMYITASGCYSEIFVGSKKYLLRTSLNNLVETLSGDRFVRIHRSTIVNLDYVKEIVHSGFSEIDARMSSNQLLHVSKSRKSEFLAKIGI